MKTVLSRPWLVYGHPHGGDGLALSGRDLHLGVGGETAGDRYGVHVVSSLVGWCWKEAAPGERWSVRGARRAEEKF